MSRPTQPRATLGKQLKTEPRCKICTSPYRGEIEDLLAIQSRRGALDDGTRVTQEYIFSLAQDRWGFQLNAANLSSHGTKHFIPGDPQVLAVTQEDAKLDLVERMRRGEIEKVPVDDALELIVGIGVAKIKADPNSVTVDHVLKASGELTKRRQDDALERQMVMAGAGLARFFGVAEAAVTKMANPEGDVVDAEVVHEIGAPDGE